MTKVHPHETCTSFWISINYRLYVRARRNKSIAIDYSRGEIKDILTIKCCINGQRRHPQRTRESKVLHWININKASPSLDHWPREVRRASERGYERSIDLISSRLPPSSPHRDAVLSQLRFDWFEIYWDWTSWLYFVPADCLRCSIPSRVQDSMRRRVGVGGENESVELVWRLRTRSFLVKGLFKLVKRK